MPEKRLHCWQIGPAFHQMCGKTVSKQMRADGFGDARSQFVLKRKRKQSRQRQPRLQALARSRA